MYDECEMPFAPSYSFSMKLKIENWGGQLDGAQLVDPLQHIHGFCYRKINNQTDDSISLRSQIIQKKIGLAPSIAFRRHQFLPRHANNKYIHVICVANM